MARKAALLFALITLLAVSAAQAQNSSDHATIDDIRRTLYVTIDEDQVRFEIPDGMCFADRTRPGEGRLFEAIAQGLRFKGDETLLGLFMTCDSLANPGHPLAREGRVPSFGIITHPYKIAARADRSSTAAYLDWRQASFHEYVALNLPGWIMAADPLRLPGDTTDPAVPAPGPAQGNNGIFTTFSQYLSADAQPFPTVGAAGTTLLRGHPVEFILRLNAASGITDEEQAYEFMRDFLDLQAAINR